MIHSRPGGRRQSLRCLVVFGFVALFVCLAYIWTVWLGKFVHYRFDPWYVEPIIQTAAMALAVVGSGILLAPGSKLAAQVAAGIPVVAVIVVHLWGLSELPFSVSLGTGLLAGGTASVLLKLLYRPWPHQRGARWLGIGILAAGFLLIWAASSFFLTDFTS